MTNFLELLNQTDGWRLFWYCVFIYCVIEAICGTILSIYKLKAIEKISGMNDKLKQDLELNKTFLST